MSYELELVLAGLPSSSMSHCGIESLWMSLKLLSSEGWGPLGRCLLNCSRLGWGSLRGWKKGLASEPRPLWLLGTSPGMGEKVVCSRGRWWTSWLRGLRHRSSRSCSPWSGLVLASVLWWPFVVLSNVGAVPFGESLLGIQWIGMWRGWRWFGHTECLVVVGVSGPSRIVPWLLLPVSKKGSGIVEATWLALLLWGELDLGGSAPSCVETESVLTRGKGLVGVGARGAGCSLGVGMEYWLSLSGDGVEK